MSENPAGGEKGKVLKGFSQSPGLYFGLIYLLIPNAPRRDSPGPKGLSTCGAQASPLLSERQSHGAHLEHAVSVLAAR